MTRFQFELATPADDAELRAVLRETSLPGRIGLRFLREPSFFDGNCVLGPLQQTIICRDRLSAEIVGFGCRSVRDVMVAGEIRPVGYLSMLRLKEEFRSLGLLSRGYRFFRELDADGRADFYLTTIAAENDRAISVLTAGRGGLPKYEFAGNYSTFLLASRCRQAAVNGVHDFHVRTATEPDLDPLLEFFCRQAQSFRYFPRYQLGDFVAAVRTFRNIEPQNIVLGVNRQGDILGAMALWDQRDFRQTVVSGYQGMLYRFRPFYNCWAHWTGRIELPQPGQPLNFGFVAFPLAADANAKLFQALLATLREQARRVRLDYLLLGCHEADPLWSTAKDLSARHYGTRLYRVSWKDRLQQRKLDDDRGLQPPYLELGCL